MNESQIAGLLFGLLCLVLVGSSLIARCLPVGQTVRYALAWALIFGVGIVLFSFREVVGQLGNAVAQLLNPSEPRHDGKAVRIRRDEDGHFNVTALVNGKKVRFLIDTGATTSTMSRAAAQDTGVLVPATGFGVLVQTSNGPAVMRRARIGELRIGGIGRNDLAILVSEDLGDVNLLGMNFLSSLSAWRVEGRELILVP
jgi:aspartyl protease family protein